jgi:predicted kinase
MKPKVMLLIGPPLSGKDTYLKSKDFRNYRIISRDDILVSLHKNDNYGEAFREVDPKIVNRILYENIQKAIDGGENVIINMTNLTKRSRERHLEKFSDYDYEKIAVVFPRLELSEYINRNLKRKQEENKFIPLNVIESMLQNWQEVTQEEGFDKIIKM